MAYFSVKIPINHEMTWEERIELFDAFCALNNCELVLHGYQPGYVEITCKTKDAIDVDALLNEDGVAGSRGPDDSELNGVEG